MNRLKLELDTGPRHSSLRPEDVDRRRLRGLVGLLVDELPPRQREVFQLSEMQGLGSSEIAEILGLAPVSVRAALLKARRALRKKMLDRHPEFVEEYVSKHGAGNPQLVLSSFAEDGQQTIAGIEGRIRQVFLEQGREDSNGVMYQDIVKKVRGSKIPLKQRP